MNRVLCSTQATKIGAVRGAENEKTTGPEGMAYQSTQG
jgi:hypothetical protein